ncbi:MAG: glycosyltransferase [Ruminococcus sp.]|nr:glycosyltransferase [Ruminococcus sp.]
MTCFVILHYLVADETISTVNSILKNVEGDLRVIVADNCSPNDSFDVLTEKYKNEPRVDVIKNSSNAGYAKGINFGYDFAKSKYSPRFIVAMNNDMEIRQGDFIKRIEHAYKKTKFFVLGPDVYSTSARKHQNPEKSHITSIEDIDRKAESVRKIMQDTKMLKIKEILRRLKPVYKFYYNIKKTKNDSEYVRKPKAGVCLHGSCLIFSELFINKREYALYPKTEFYCEAQILDYECKRDGMRQIYSPYLIVLHHEDVATEAVNGSYSAKMIKKCERVLASLEIFRQLILKDERENHG